MQVQDVRVVGAMQGVETPRWESKQCGGHTARSHEVGIGRDGARTIGALAGWARYLRGHGCLSFEALSLGFSQWMGR